LLILSAWLTTLCFLDSFSTNGFAPAKPVSSQPATYILKLVGYSLNNLLVLLRKGRTPRWVGPKRALKRAKKGERIILAPSRGSFLFLFYNF
jgi:hypothetical protein